MDLASKDRSYNYSQGYLHFAHTFFAPPPTKGEVSQEELPSPRISCPKGSKAYGSHCYAVYRTPKSWIDADVSACMWSCALQERLIGGVLQCFL